MADPTPIALSEQVYYLPGSVNTVIVRAPEDRAILVDTGQDKDSGRRLARACETLSLTPVAILNTHAHADHYGGNDYLVRNLKLPVYAPPFEASLMQSPYLEPVYLFGGAKPLKEMMSKWLLAKASPVDHLLTPGPLELAGARLELIDTSGHAHSHYAALVSDVLIAADAVFGTEVLARYPLPFGQDIGGQIASAERVATLGARAVLPGHGEPSEDVAGLVAHNLAAFHHAAEVVAASCTGGDSAEVLALCCQQLGVHMTDLPRYTLNLCTVMAYLSYLRETDRVTLTLENNRLRWQRV